MAKQIAKLLKATIQDSSDLKQIAKQLAGKGRGGDSMLVHITPREAMMLKDAGGAGTINPDTGLMEFYDGGYDLMRYAGDPDITTGGYTRSMTQSVPTPSVSDYVPSGRYDLMQFGGSPNVQTGGYQRPTYTPAGGRTDLMNLGTGEFNPRTGGVTGQPTDVTGDFSLYGVRPGSQNLRMPSAPGLRMTPEAAAAAPPAPYMPGAYTPVGEVQQALTREPSVAQRLKSTLTSPRMIENLALGGLQALPGIIASRNAARQGQRAREEMQAMAEPYRQRGQELLAQAQSGALSPAEQQQLQAMQARIAQGVAGRGGVGAEQAQVQLEAFRQQILQNKYDLGLKVSGIADSIATGAIKAGLEADQYVSELTGNYFSNAMQMAMMNMGQRPQGV